MTSAPICISCNKPKATLECGLCNTPVCKKCAVILGEERFSFLQSVPAHLSHAVYCNPCFNASVAADLEKYDATMAAAKEVLVYLKKQSKETRLISRREDWIEIKDVVDHDEAILRLAFYAAEKGFNAIIDVETSSEKIKNGSYTTMKWKCKGVPAHVDADRIIKDRSLWQNPN